MKRDTRAYIMHIIINCMYTYNMRTDVYNDYVHNCAYNNKQYVASYHQQVIHV